MGIPKTRGYPNHCDSASPNLKKGKSPGNEIDFVEFKIDDDDDDDLL